MSNTTEVTIGLYGIGLDTYWPQFDGLLPRLQGHLHKAAEKIEAVVHR